MAKIKTPSDWGAFFIATTAGAGLLPKAPGTFGTLFAIPIAYYTLDWPWGPRILFWIGILLIGAWAASRYDRILGTHDHGSIVIDEVLGFGVASALLTQNLPHLLLAFVLFRFFDIVKLPPVNWIDRWSKERGSSLAVMGDDAVAGLQALLVIWILQSMYLLET